MSANETYRVCKLMVQVAEGLKNPNAHVPLSKKDKSLGDRNTYIGASSATGCLYKAYMDVKDLSNEISPQQMFVFERGHQLEEMVRKGLNGLGWKEIDEISSAYEENTFIHQLEIEGAGYWSFIKAHLDFVFIGKNELVIKEFKSSATIPDRPYESHILQSMMQKWLLMSKFPNKKIRASVIYHNWDTGESIDYPIEYSETELKKALKQAKRLWISMQKEVAPKPEKQLYCGKCKYKDTCPALCFGADQNLPADLVPMAQRLSDHKQREKDMAKLKKNFVSLLKASGIKKAKLGETVLEVIQVEGKKMVSVERLFHEHKDIYDQLAEEVNGYEYLKIT